MDGENDECSIKMMSFFDIKNGEFWQVSQGGAFSIEEKCWLILEMSFFYIKNVDWF